MAKKFYLKERHNPQTGIYYVMEGQLTKAEASRKEKTLYGINVMLEFENENEYQQKIADLKILNYKIHE